MPQSILRALAPPLRGDTSQPRVVWLIFDELDERVAFAARPANLSLPEFDRLRAAGYDRPFTKLEDGVGDYVGRYLSQPDPYR